MNAAKSGFIAAFRYAYLQKEERLICTVAGGTDKGLRDQTKVGYAVGRLVKIAAPVGGVRALTAPSGVTADSIGDATHIIAQCDDTVRDVPEDFNYPERYSTQPNLICKNSDSESKTVAVYKIINPDDIIITNLDA